MSNLDSYISEDLPIEPTHPKIYLLKNIMLLANSLGILSGCDQLAKRVCTCSPFDHSDENEYCPVTRWNKSIALGGLYANDILVELVMRELKQNNIELVISNDKTDYRKAFQVEAKMHYETSQKYTELLEALAPLYSELWVMLSYGSAKHKDVYKLQTLIEQSGVINLEEE